MELTLYTWPACHASIHLSFIRLLIHPLDGCHVSGVVLGFEATVVKQIRPQSLWRSKFREIDT